MQSPALARGFVIGYPTAISVKCIIAIVNGSLQFGHVSWTKLQPSLVYEIAPQWSVQIGGFITVAGINAGRELGPTAGVWYRF